MVTNQRFCTQNRYPLVLIWSDTMRTCIIIPMHNEESVAKNSVKLILEYIKQIPAEITLLVVNDGSQDATKKIIEDLINKNKDSHLQIISHSVNKGYGAALRTGIKFAINNQYDYAIFMDSDMTNHPKYINEFYKKMLEGYDYIKATRYLKGGGAEGVLLYRRILSKVGNFVAKILYGLPLTDFTNGFRAVKLDILKKIDLTEKDFSIIMEELFKVKYLTKSFCEIPYILTTREEAQRSTHFSYSIGTCIKYLRYALKAFLKKQ